MARTTSFAGALCTQRLFFFSSRRRHTRSKRDWSSDVCSSDLSWWMSPPWKRMWRRWRSIARRPAARSEERRVGKECRYQGDPTPDEKNVLTHDRAVALDE